MGKTPDPPQAAGKCRACGCPMTFAVNIDTGKSGPVDLRSTVYFVRKAVNGQGQPLAMTAKKLLEVLKSITVEIDGQEVVYGRDEIEGFFPSHFNTCPKASKF